MYKKAKIKLGKSMILGIVWLIVYGFSVNIYYKTNELAFCLIMLFALTKMLARYYDVGYYNAICTLTKPLEEGNKDVSSEMVNTKD